MSPNRHSTFPLRGWIGLTLVAVFWALNWGLDGLRTHWGFFPLWLGYCLIMDAWTFRRRGSSLWTRSRRNYVGLFFVSAPAWWLFEVINWRTGNWSYLGRDSFTDLEYFAMGSVSFSTVIPAVFGTAELFSTLGWIGRFSQGPKILVDTRRVAAIFVAGFGMLALLLAWPLYFFPFVWISVFCILDPLNYALGNRSLTRYAASGEWRPVIALSTGCIVCGFFWEMWNFFSYPKWVYEVPFVDFLHVFEMPLLGFGGYVPFALELFALYHLAMGLFRNDAARSFLRLVPEGSD